MKFSVYLPPQAKAGKVPVVFYLSGLTCTEETFPIKAHAQKTASGAGSDVDRAGHQSARAAAAGRCGQLGFRLLRGFYVDSTQAPWIAVLPHVQLRHQGIAGSGGRRTSVLAGATGIFGHSMGGHGALVCALRNPDKYNRCPLSRPIAAPTQCPWGKKAFTHYLGSDTQSWREYDASELMTRRAFPNHILVDQGTSDQFLAEQLLPDKLSAGRGEVRPAADPADAARLRSRLLLHPDLHGRSPAASREAAEALGGERRQRARAPAASAGAACAIGSVPCADRKSLARARNSSILPDDGCNEAVDDRAGAGIAVSVEEAQFCGYPCNCKRRVRPMCGYLRDPPPLSHPCDGRLGRRCAVR